MVALLVFLGAGSVAPSAASYISPPSDATRTARATAKLTNQRDADIGSRSHGLPNASHAGSDAPALTLSYRGIVRDRVGKGNTAVSADGALDGVFAVQVGAGSGSVNVVQMELRRTDGGGTWDTLSSTNWWALGAAGSLDGLVYNNSAAGVNFLAFGGGTFYVFASDLYPSLFAAGRQFQLRVWLADGSIATVTTTLSAPAPPTLSLSYRGKVRDRVGRDSAAVTADSDTDGVFAVTLDAGSGSRTVLQMELRRTDGPGGRLGHDPNYELVGARRG
ncbi:MAG TPA: hypothetical protein VF101_11915 [Gaiellaceae bacterium]